MTILIKDLSSKKLDLLVSLIKAEGFKIEYKGNKRIEFSLGLRHFSLYSTNITDAEFGLTTFFDIDNFLKNNYKEKPKHSVSLKEHTEKKEISVEDGCDILHWEIIKCYNLKDFTYTSFMEDPIAETLYQVNIRGLSHIIIDEDVYEGELDTIISFLSLSALDCFKLLNKQKLLDDIKNFK